MSYTGTEHICEFCQFDMTPLITAVNSHEIDKHLDGKCVALSTSGQEIAQSEPKFHVGQIVVVKSLKKQLPFRIIGVTWNDGWFYQWNRRNYAAESMLRELTDEEKS